jgi:type IV secretion system protein TrbF
MESEFYLQARREWDERYGDLVLGKRNWQITSAGLMLLSLILALGIVWMSARIKVIPFVVEVDKLGYAITIPTALTASTTPATVERMKRYEIAAFIRDARSVSSDPAVEQNMLNDLLAHAHARCGEQVPRVPDFKRGNDGAGGQGRTGDVQLGKLAFYR